MKSPASRVGNLVRFSVFLVLIAITRWLQLMATDNNKISGIFTLLFFAIAALTLLFFIRQFNLEKRYFIEKLNTLKEVFDNAFGFLCFIFIAIGILSLAVAALQAQGLLPSFTQTTSFEFKDWRFWVYLLMVGIIIPIIQQYLVNGFFFNYFFRTETPFTIVAGMLLSGLVFSILQWQPLFMPAFIQLSLGWLFSLSYLRTRSLAVPVLLNIFSAMIFVILG